MPLPLGTVVFFHTTGLPARAIQFGERLRFKRRQHQEALAQLGLIAPYAINHVGIVTDYDADGNELITQAEPSGVTNDKTLAAIAPGGFYIAVAPGLGVASADMLEFLNGEVGSGYGWLTILSIAIDILTPLWFIAVRRRFSWVCSALAAEALRAGGWIYRWADVYCVTPTDLLLALLQQGGRVVSHQH